MAADEGVAVRLFDRLPWPRTRLVLGHRATAIIGGAAFLVAFLRGLDYVIPPDSAATGLSLVERALPLAAWGWVWLVCGLVGLLGMWFGRYGVVAAAHGGLVGLYLAFGVGNLIDVLQRDPIYGWRTASGWILVGATLSMILADAATKEARRAQV